MRRFVLTTAAAFSIISAPVLAQSLSGLRIEGPDTVDEETITYYNVIAEFDNGLEFDVTLFGALWLDPGVSATVGVFGDVWSMDVDGDEVETLCALYSFGADTQMACTDITIRDLPPGKYALDFDGLDDHVTAPGAEHLNITADLTLEAWIKADDPDGNNRIVGYGAEGESLDTNFVYMWAIQSGEVRLFHEPANPANNQEVVFDTDLAAGRWYHLAAVRDADASTYTLYIDGLEFGSGGYAEQPAGGSAGNLWIGSQDPGTPAYFDGQIDEVRIWNVAQTQAEICQNMHRRLAGDEPGLVGYWRFDEGQGQIAYDSSPNGNHGTLGSNDDPGGDGSDPAWVESEAGLVKGDLLGVEVTGPDEIASGGQASYAVVASFDEGQIDVTACADWSIDPPDAASIDAPGKLTAAEVGTEDLAALLTASYTDDTGTTAGDKPVTIATISGPRYALEFDGTDDYVRVPQSPVLEPTDEVTVEAWIRPDSAGGENNRIVRNAGQAASGYILAGQNGNDRRVQLRIDEATGGSTRATDDVPIDTYFGEWHHVAGVYSATADLCQLYIDGVLKDAVSSVGTLQYSGDDLHIGNYEPFAGEDFAGAIDEVRIWNVARTPCEIRHNMHRQLRGDEGGLVGYWRFDEGEGQTAHDSSKYHNHGTLGTNDDPGGDPSDPAWVLSGAGINEAAFPPPVWSEPQLFTPANSTSADRSVRFSYDGLSFYVKTERDGHFGDSQVYRADRPDAASPWSSPVPVDELNSGIHDEVTWVSPDNLEVYLSRHGNPNPEWDIYRSTRASTLDPWGVPSPVAELNTTARDNGLVATADGLYALFTSRRAGGAGGNDVWETSRPDTSSPWSIPTNVSALNTTDHEAPAYLSADGLSLLLTSTRPGGIGGYDVYIATRSSMLDPFGEPVLADGINSSADEFNCDLSSDGKTLFFHSNRLGSPGGDAIWYSTLLSPLPPTVGPDFDGDCDVDEDDYDFFELCATGPGIGPVSPECEATDFDTDGDTDQGDYGIFQRCYGGEGVIPPPECDD